MEKAQTEEKKTGLKPYSDEILVLEKPGPYEIAYDYISGNRVREESAVIATGVLSELAIVADTKNDKFRNMKTTHLKRSKGTKQEWHELNFLVEGQQNQIKRAEEFIYKKYKIKAATIDDADKVKALRESRVYHPLPQTNLSPTT